MTYGNDGHHSFPGTEITSRLGCRLPKCPENGGRSQILFLSYRSSPEVNASMQPIAGREESSRHPKRGANPGRHRPGRLCTHSCLAA